MCTAENDAELITKEPPSSQKITSQDASLAEKT